MSRMDQLASLPRMAYLQARNGALATYPSDEGRGMALAAAPARRQRSSGELGCVVRPIPGQELIELADVVIVDAHVHVSRRALQHRTRLASLRDLDAFRTAYWADATAQFAILGSAVGIGVC
jgi:hypothetical protein